MIFNQRPTTRTLVTAFVVAAALALTVPAGADDDARIPFPKPGSHKANWIGYHGKYVAAAGALPGRPPASCLVCHERQDCVACHLTIMPRDHTNFWRTRAHGLMAKGNRERCLVCHRQDYCIRCHSETAPRSHTASWLGRHCSVCHFGPGKTITGECAVCHRHGKHVP